MLFFAAMLHFTNYKSFISILGGIYSWGRHRHAHTCMHVHTCAYMHACTHAYTNNGFLPLKMECMNYTHIDMHSKTTSLGWLSDICHLPTYPSQSAGSAIRSNILTTEQHTHTDTHRVIGYSGCMKYIFQAYECSPWLNTWKGVLGDFPKEIAITSSNSIYYSWKNITVYWAVFHHWNKKLCLILYFGNRDVM